MGEDLIRSIMDKYKVKQGDCLSSIGYAHGYAWQTLWNHPENNLLKQKRKDPNILYPGDEVYIPEPEEKEESCALQKKHRFRMKGVPVKFKVHVRRLGNPRANEPYTLTIDDDKRYEGKTNGDGLVEVSISPKAKQGLLTIGKDDLDKQTFELDFGGMDPITETAGVQKRLANLGYACEITGELDEQTKAAVSAFQKTHGLEPTGQINDQTRNKLVEEYGS